MSERLPRAQNPFSSNLSAVLVGAGTLLFTLIFILLAWSPDLATKNRAGQHAYSKSALGYAGLVTLLEADGQSVSISRLASTLNYTDGPLIITLPPSKLTRACNRSSARLGKAIVVKMAAVMKCLIVSSPRPAAWP